MTKKERIKRDREIRQLKKIGWEVLDIKLVYGLSIGQIYNILKPVHNSLDNKSEKD
jgi:hypothetical protein